MNGVKYVESSQNSKIGDADATYVSIKGSCPVSCPLKGGRGCYAETSYTGILVRKLDIETINLTPTEIAEAEAEAIDKSYKGKTLPMGRKLRLHVCGDCREQEGARIVNEAVGRWLKRGGEVCWSYTRAWDIVPRDVWNNVSILASVSSVIQALEAREQGYIPAIIIDKYNGEKSFILDNVTDIKFIPCPAQTKHIKCIDCGLCMRVDSLYKQGRGIAFVAHGSKRKQTKAVKI